MPSVAIAAFQRDFLAGLDAAVNALSVDKHHAEEAKAQKKHDRSAVATMLHGVLGSYVVVDSSNFGHIERVFFAALDAAVAVQAAATKAHHPTTSKSPQTSPKFTAAKSPPHSPKLGGAAAPAAAETATTDAISKRVANAAKEVFGKLKPK